MILPLLTKVPITIWLAGAIAIWGAYGHSKYKSLRSEWDRYTLEQVEIRAEAERQARIVEDKKRENLRSLETAYYEQVKTSQTYANNVRSINDRLRKSIQAAQTSRIEAGTNTATECTVDARRIEALERLFIESVGLVEEGAGRVGELSAKTSALQRYISDVCLSTKNANH